MAGFLFDILCHLAIIKIDIKICKSFVSQSGKSLLAVTITTATSDCRQMANFLYL